MDQITVKTATGKVYTIRFIGATSAGIIQLLYIEFIGYTMMEIVRVFSDKQETYHLEGYIDGEFTKEFNGYTNLIEAITLAETGNLRIALTAPIEPLGEVQ